MLNVADAFVEARAPRLIVVKSTPRQGAGAAGGGEAAPPRAITVVADRRRGRWTPAY
ncbi:MAG: hypothetical protein HXY24_04535 [Rubrivivax sp.]|nr:hypothetical protein [Rubrivivax sp.]